MDLIYTGSGNIAGDSEEYKRVIDMLQINTIVVDTLDCLEGFSVEDILDQFGNDANFQDIISSSKVPDDKLVILENSNQTARGLQENKSQ